VNAVIRSETAQGGATRPEGPGSGSGRTGRSGRSRPGVAGGLPVLLLLLVSLGTGCSSVPAYQEMGADELFAWSNQMFEEGDYNEAVKGYERMIFMYPAYAQIVDVRLNLGWSYFNRREYVTSAAEFARLQDRHPGHPLVSQAALGGCRSYAALSPIPQRDQAFTQSALNTCTSVLIDYPGTPEAAEARAVRDEMINKLAEKEYLRGHFYFRRNFYDSANVYFQQVLDLYPQSHWAPTALLSMHEGYLSIGYEEEAEEVRNRILNEYPDSPEAETIRSGSEPAPVDPAETVVPDTSGVAFPAPA
jgi:outer membrane protein assembly factor BamD